MKKIVLLVIFCLFSMLQLQAQIWKECNNGFDKTETMTETKYHNFDSLIIYNNLLFAIDNYQIYSSTDYGISWADWATFNSKIIFFKTQGNIIYIVTNSNIFISSNMGQKWIDKSNGLYGTLKDLFINGNDLYTTTTNGIYYSSNSGDSWTQRNSSISQNIKSLTFIDNNIIANTANGIFLSNNTARSWTLKNSGLSDSTANNILVVNDKILISTNHGVYRSSNNGDNWEKCNNNINGTVYFLIESKNCIIASTLTDIYISFDFGNNWTRKNQGLSGTLNYITSNENDVYAIADHKNIFVLANNGDNWIQKNANLNGSINKLQISNNFAIVFAEPNNAFISTNNCATWSAIKIAYEVITTKHIVIRKHVHEFQVIGNRLYALLDSAYSKIYFTDDSANKWNDNGNRWAESIIGHATFHFDNNKYYAISNDGLFISNNNGSSWQLINKNDFNEKTVCDMVFANNKIYLATKYLGICVSSDDGLNWSENYNGLPDEAILFVRVIGNKIYAFTSSNIYISSDDCKTWQKKVTNINYKIKSLVLGNDNFVMLTDLGIITANYSNDTYVIKNDGITGSVKCIVTAANHYFAVTNNAVYLSNNYCDTWAKIFTGVTYRNIDNIQIINNIVFLFYVAGSDQPKEFFISTDYGESWLNKNDGIYSVEKYTITYLNGYYFVGTNFGVYRTSPYILLKTKPKISNIEDIIIEENSTGEASFTIDGTDPNTLQLSKETTDTQLLPLDNLLFSGTEKNRKLTITPAKNKYGSANITIKVSDGTDIASTTFRVTVEHIKMTITQIKDIEINEDSVATVPFLVNAADISKLKFVKESTNSVLLPIDSLEIVGAGTNRNLIISPKKQSIGTSYITIRITDSSETVGTIFRVKVIELKPTITQIPDIIMNQNTSKDVQFSINGKNPANLTFIKETDDEKLIPIDNMIITGSGKDYNLKITPIQNKTGSCYLTVYVTNNADTASTMFQVTVQKGGYVENDLLNTIEILISPNPVRSNFSVISETLIIQEIQVFDVLGALVLKTENNQNIDVSNLPAGVYFCLLKSGGNYYAKKFVIVR